MAGKSTKDLCVLGKQINHICKIKGITKIDITRTSGIQYSTIESWCTGKSSPRVADLKYLADCLGVTVSYLLDEDNSMLCKYEELQAYAKKALYWYLHKHKMPSEWYGTVDEFIDHDFRNYVEE